MSSLCLHTPLYKRHPLWPQRRLTIIAIAFGIILNMIIVSDSRGSCNWIAANNIFFMLLSLAFIIWDLQRYDHEVLIRFLVGIERRYNTNPPPNREDAVFGPEALQENLSVADQTHSDSAEPLEITWPKRDSTIIDCLFAMVFLFLSIAAFGCVTSNYYFSPSLAFLSYSSLTTIVLAILHARAFWKQFMARKKAKWERERNNPSDDGCWCCNRGNGGPRPPPQPTLGLESILGGNSNCCHQEAERFNNGGRSRWIPTYTLPNLFARRGKRVDIETGPPEPADRGVQSDASEESLLITPSEYESGGASRAYGATAGPSTPPLLSAEEQRVKKKRTGKGKGKALARSEDEADA